MVEFRVATYNVLSSSLADPPRFPKCDPKHLDGPTRLERVKAKLQEEVSKEAVLCLQEVSTLWAGELHVFFMSKGYACVPAHYGNSHSGYMGVAIAWPLAKYEAVTVDITRLSDTRKWVARTREQPPPQPSPQTPAMPASPTAVAAVAAWAGLGAGEGWQWGGPVTLLMKMAGRAKKRRREEEGGDTPVRNVRAAVVEKEDPWQMAERRFNQALFVRLHPKGTAAGNGVPNGSVNASSNGGSEPVPGVQGTEEEPGRTRRQVFCVGTYHMPCLFNHPPVMVMHTSMLVKHLARLAGSDPLVIAGDFNFNPSSDCYKIITEGDLSDSSPDFPERPEWEQGWSAATGVKLLSAYKEVEGTEPDFTNNAQVEQWPPYIDTLDYLFHTPNLRATKVLTLKHRSEVEGPFPTETEPSDHVLLAAEYTM